MRATLINEGERKSMKGNGSHQAICEVKGCFCSDETGDYLILTDGTRVDARPRYMKQKKNYLGVHIFRAYPKMKRRKLDSFTLIGYDRERIFEDELFKFCGVWQKGRLVVERDKKMCLSRPVPRKKYWFKNYSKVKGDNELVEILAVRKNNILFIKSVKVLKEKNNAK